MEEKETKLANLRTKIAGSKETVEKLKEDLSQAELEAERLATKKKTIDVTREDGRSRVKDLEKALSSALRELQNAKYVLETTEEGLGSARQGMRDLENQMRKRRLHKDSSQGERAQKRSTYEKALSDLVATKRILEEEANVAKEEFLKAKENVKEKQNEISTLKRAIDSKARRKATCEDELKMELTSGQSQLRLFGPEYVNLVQDIERSVGR